MTRRPSPKRSASRAGLRHVDVQEPGYGRVRSARGFTYRDWRGRPVKSKKLRDRFAGLVIPPAWEDVWICRDDRGHIQATGRDEAGRKQYLYHPRWRRRRDDEKFRRLAAFGAALPLIRGRVRRHLRGKGLGRERVLAAIVKLLETSLARVGNSEYARTNGSFGLTTIRKRHVRHEKGRTILRFTGKSGRAWELEVEDPQVIDVIERCLATPGLEVFKYIDDRGITKDVTASDVNAYLSEIAGADVTAKDFRTWAGTVLTSRALREIERADPSAKAKQKIRAAIAAVAGKLGNTPAICQSSYVHPEVLESVEDGALIEHLTTVTHVARKGLRTEEVAILTYIAHDVFDADKAAE